jgi:threonyl-tRNA synthetase
LAGASYAKKIYARCVRKKARVQFDARSDKISYRIREAEVQKIPYILVVGKREVKNKSVSVRKHGEGDLGEMDMKSFFNILKQEQGGEN